MWIQLTQRVYRASNSYCMLIKMSYCMLIKIITHPPWIATGGVNRCQQAACDYLIQLQATFKSGFVEAL